jgi:hypothetical protein
VTRNYLLYLSILDSWWLRLEETAWKRSLFAMLMLKRMNWCNMVRWIASSPASAFLWKMSKSLLNQLQNLKRKRVQSQKRSRSNPNILTGIISRCPIVLRLYFLLGLTCLSIIMLNPLKKLKSQSLIWN